ncbi:LPXTG cell wall anchor domain-containing protein [Streptomyces sp. NPDC020607]|uniref:LPXTG cell wall anchor domain-containing protein n=1 Tax=Streptomyces sp. NPDC020607 TaxID=3365082 RepID=UPI00379E9954
MKLRRAMAAAAATAVIAPIALLSAPAASATEDTSTPPAPAAGVPTESATPTPSVTPPAKTPEPAKTPGKPTPPSEPPARKHTAEVEDPKAPRTPEVPEVPDEDDEKAPPTCESDNGSTDPDSVLEVDFVGLPEKIVAGSGWHRFKLTADNPTDEPLGEVAWTTFVNNLGAKKDSKDALRYFTDVQYFDAVEDEWTTVDSPLGDGLAYDTVELDAEDKAVVKLRARINAKAPVGKGYVEGLGTYVDPELDCTHTSEKYQPITVVKAGGDDESAEPTPKPSTSKTAQTVPEPQGSASEAPTPAPATGSLAETGSSSMLPTVGVIGGIAVVAGAGVVFAVRRRKADGTV